MFPSLLTNIIKLTCSLTLHSFSVLILSCLSWNMCPVDDCKLSFLGFPKYFLYVAWVVCLNSNCLWYGHYLTFFNTFALDFVVITSKILSFDFMFLFKKILKRSCLKCLVYFPNAFAGWWNRSCHVLAALWS